MKYNPLQKEERMACSMCNCENAQFCWKQRRCSCNEASLKGMDSDSKKVPKECRAKVPVQTSDDRSLQRDLYNEPIFKAHQEK